MGREVSPWRETSNIIIIQYLSSFLSLFLQPFSLFYLLYIYYLTRFKTVGKIIEEINVPLYCIRYIKSPVVTFLVLRSDYCTKYCYFSLLSFVLFYNNNMSSFEK